MALEPINNGDGGAETRYKMNQIIDAFGAVDADVLADMVAAQAATEAARDDAVDAATDAQSRFEASKNKFDASGPYLVDSQFSSAGAVLTNPAFSTSRVYTDYIPVLPSTSYVSNNAINITIVWYDAALAIIGAASYTMNSTVPRTSPSNAAFMRVAFTPASISPSGLQIEAGATPTTYEAYALRLKQTAIPVVGNDKIADSAVTPAKTDFMKPGDNIFNKDASFVSPNALSGTGSIQGSSGNNRVYEPMEIKPNTVYYSNQSTNINIAWLDASFSVIGGTIYTLNSSTPRTSPSNAKYIRIASSPDAFSQSELQIEADKVTYYKPYKVRPTNGPTESQVVEALQWTKGDLVVPRKSYLLKSASNNFYYAAMQRRNINGQFFTRVSGSVGGAAAAIRDRYSRWLPTATGTAVLTAVLYNAEFDPVVTKTTTAIVTDPATPTTATKVQLIGDSWADISVTQRTILQTLTGVSFVGSRRTLAPQSIYWSGGELRYDGRSGADMAYLFNAIKSPGVPSGASGFSPFIHPSGYAFIGNTNSWRGALISNASFTGSITGTTLTVSGLTGSLSAGGYISGPGVTPGTYLVSGSGSSWQVNQTQTVASAAMVKHAPVTFVQGLTQLALTFRGGFDAATGYPTTPVLNDVLWDDTLSLFKYWDGSAWQTGSMVVGDFVFNYAQYLSTYSVPAPDILFFAMGINDFSNAAPRDVAGRGGPVEQPRGKFNLWHTAANTGYLDKAIASIQAYNPAIKIGVVVPPVLQDLNSNTANAFQAQRTAAMWEARRKILETWDTPAMEAANVFAVDAGCALDPRYGYSRTTVTPFVGYAGTETEFESADPTHATAEGFAQYSVPLSAFIQAVR